MVQRESAENISKDAADWAAKVDRGLSEREEAELTDWLAADDRRVGALAQAQAAWVHAERAGALGDPPRPAPQAEGRILRATAARGLGRRRFMFGAGAIAATAAVAVPLLASRERILTTAPGEVRRVTLEDGSALTLDTASRLGVTFGRHRRAARLVEGRIFLEIAADAARPFTLGVRQAVLHAVDAAFSVEAVEDRPLDVVVGRGRIAVEQRSEAGQGIPRVLLTARTELSVPIGAQIAETMVRRMSPDEVARLLQWRSGLLSFAGETLGEAAALFNRYGGVQIVVADADLAREPIAGVFQSSDARGFALAIAASLGAKASDQGRKVIVWR